MKRIVLSVLLPAAMVFLAAGVVSAQSAPRAPITVVYPANGTAVHIPAFTFSWDRVFAYSFHVTLQHKGGTRLAKFSLLESECGGICAVDFDPAAHDWIWIDGAQYTWQVKAKDEQGQVLAKSKKKTITADMLPAIEINSPADHHHVSYEAGGFTHIPFTWEQGDFYFFRLLIWNKKGKVYYDIGWNPWHAACDINGECTYYVKFSSTKAGLKQFTWRVYAKRQFVSGRSSSAKRNLSVTATPP